MHRMVLFAIAAGVGWTTSGCAVTSAPDELKLDRTHAGKTFDLARGGMLEVTLDGNPTTGYSWRLLSGNGAALRPAGDCAYKQDAAPAGRVGVGGKFIFKFKAVGAGTAQLRFGYQRPWETMVPPAEVFQASINVK